MGSIVVAYLVASVTFLMASGWVRVVAGFLAGLGLVTTVAGAAWRAEGGSGAAMALLVFILLACLWAAIWWLRTHGLETASRVLGIAGLVLLTAAVWRGAREGR